MRLAEIRDTKRDLYYFQLRLGVAAVIVFAAFTVLFGRFFYLQVIQHQYYDTKAEDRKSTRLNSSHGSTSYAVFCLKKKTPGTNTTILRKPISLLRSSTSPKRISSASLHTRVRLPHA